MPEGVELRDAADILPESTIIRHHSGSVSLFSNRFRYALMARGLGTWLDADAYLLKPLESERPYLFGACDLGWINGAILRLPPDSPVLPPLLELFEERTVPPWLPWRARAGAAWRLARTGRSGLSHMPWGSAGPRALTAMLRAHGLLHLAEPADVFYPVAWTDADWLRDPAQPVEEKITERTVSIHLWNERIKHFKDLPAPAGSFLERLQEEGSLAPRPPGAVSA